MTSEAGQLALRVLAYVRPEAGRAVVQDDLHDPSIGLNRNLRSARANDSYFVEGLYPGGGGNRDRISFGSGIPCAKMRSRIFGRSPVGLNSAITLPSAVAPFCSRTKMSCIVMMSISIPTISEIAVTLRDPSRSRLSWQMMLMAEATCCRIALTGRSMPALKTRVSRRGSASRELLAWVVVIDPSCPVFMAC